MGMGHGHGAGGMGWSVGTGVQNAPLGQGGGFFGLAGGGCIGLGEGDGDVAVKGGLCHLMPWL